MPQAPQPRPHGVGIRGLNLDRSSPLFAGSFGRIFRALPPADFGDTDQQSQDALQKLGGAMVGDPDAPKDGPDPEESGLPALYTYLGQFLDHDITFDPASSCNARMIQMRSSTTARLVSTSTAFTGEDRMISRTCT